MEQLLDHLPTYKNSLLGGKFDLNGGRTESILQSLKPFFICFLSVVGDWKIGWDKAIWQSATGSGDVEEEGR